LLTHPILSNAKILAMTTRYVYGPVQSWRSGTSLGIDPIGKISTCSFNCAYCQLGIIQNISQEIRTYVPTSNLLSDLTELELAASFRYEDLDVITFAGSGEPTLAANLQEMILAIRELYAKRSKRVPISILTNATMLKQVSVRQAVLMADLISLKLDAPTDAVLNSVNQPANGITMESIIEGIKLLSDDCKRLAELAPTLQLQIMFLPKFLKDSQYLAQMIALIKELAVYKIQINTPTRAKPISKAGEYWIDSRGNHYGDKSPDYIELRELPVITQSEAIALERQLQTAIPELQIINVYKH
jgi:wyosine [tRNA(Phe)-imidazoG37] synthetase (radical SAM superfamily)